MESEKMNGKNFAIEKGNWALTFSVDNTCEISTGDIEKEDITLPGSVDFKIELFAVEGE